MTTPHHVFPQFSSNRNELGDGMGDGLSHGSGDDLGNGGFTVLECLLALAFLAMLTALLPSTIRFANRASQFGVALTNESSVSSSALAFNRLLAEAMPLTLADETGALRVAFVGDERSVKFVAPMLGAPQGAGLYVIELASVRDAADVAAGVSLKTYPLTSAVWTTIDPAAAAATNSIAQRPLAAGVWAVRFRYFGISGNLTEPTWHLQWVAPNRIPDLVEISFERGVRPTVTSTVTLVVELMLRNRRQAVALQ